MQQSRTGTVRAAVVGTGFGVSGHVHGYRMCEEVEVVALAGAQPEKTRRLADQLGIPHAVSSIEEVLALPDVDVVSIATPTGNHARETILALDAGKHVVVEKPMAVNVGEAEAMVAALERSGRIGVINTELRFNPTRQRLKALVDEGYLGRVYHVAVHSYQDYRSAPWTWRAGADHGMTRANGAHLVDLVCWVFGDIQSVLVGVVETQITERADAEGIVRPWLCDDVSSFTARLAGGGLALCALSGVAGLPPTRPEFEAGHMRVEAFGERGTLILDLDDRLMGSRLGEGGWTDFTQPEPLLADERLPKRVWETATARLLRQVVGAIRGENDLGPAATFYNGLAATRVLDAALAYFTPASAAAAAQPSPAERPAVPA